MATVIPQQDPLVAAVRKDLALEGVRTVHVAGGGVPPARAQRTRFPRLLVVLQGSLTVETGDQDRVRRIQLHPGEALYAPEGTWDRPDWEARCRLLNVLFGSRHIGLSLVELGPEGPSATKAGSNWPSDGVLQALLACLRASAARQQRTELEAALVPGLLEECLVNLRRGAGRDGKALHTFEALCLYIQSNLALPLTRESLAAHFGLSPNHISRLFRQQGHHRFVDYLNQVRLDHAQHLLQDSDLPIKEVAARAGFQDHAYFHRVFRKMAKVTPLAYRIGKTRT